jgi:hypothetical protein
VIPFGWESRVCPTCDGQPLPIEVVKLGDKIYPQPQRTCITCRGFKFLVLPAADPIRRASEAVKAHNRAVMMIPILERQIAKLRAQLLGSRP